MKDDDELLELIQTAERREMVKILHPMHTITYSQFLKRIDRPFHLELFAWKNRN